MNAQTQRTPGPCNSTVSAEAVECAKLRAIYLRAAQEAESMWGDTASANYNWDRAEDMTDAVVRAARIIEARAALAKVKP